MLQNRHSGCILNIVYEISYNDCLHRFEAPMKNPAFAVALSAVPVSYTHLTLPTKA